MRTPWLERIPSKQTLTRYLAQAQAAVRLRGQVTVLLTTDAAIRRLNRQFRGKNKATDVLTFPAIPFPVSKSRPRAPASQRIVGDLAVSVETAREQATEHGHALTCELKVLILHGLLHLAGYDHEIDAGEMARRECALRARLGLPLGLIERTQTARVEAKSRGRFHAVMTNRKARATARATATADPSTARFARSANRSAQDDNSAKGKRP